MNTIKNNKLIRSLFGYFRFGKMSAALLISILLMLTGCTKEEGYGGLASISGKVFAYDFDKDGVEIASGYVGDVVVYLGAEGSSEVIDRIRTSHDGSFKFSKLRKGQYNVWVFSQCRNCPNEQEAVIQKVEIKSRKSDIELDVFEINV